MELRRAAICHECLSALRQPVRTSTTTRFAPISLYIQQSSSRRALSARAHNERLRSTGRSAPKSSHSPIGILESLLIAARSTHTVSSVDLNALHNRVSTLANSALRPDDGKLPEEQRVLYVLEQFDALAQSLIDGHNADAAKTAGADGGGDGKADNMTTATSALLGSVNARNYPAFISKASVLNLISERAEELLRHPNIFITPAILRSYVDLQTLLHRPASFPDIFHLYAHKPLPQQAAQPNASITYQPAAPDKISAAVDSKTANTALASAITAHNLPLAIDIINTTLCTPAFKKSKILRQLAIPISGLAIAPLAAYTLSAQFGEWQNTMDPSYATGVAMAGILTYVASVTSIGYVAITTANDQMDRVTWAQGVPLWERWIREEERAAIDLVAGKWGFQGLEKRGEEEGVEWEGLREFVGLRAMVLDRAELLEGME
ncbi:hypothetical protein LTR36_001087 [Oleoguttula mirabilis]|uniref:Uncharacterized protein n=1 Tax=Oleoguttula mirabilis TaxID=1507867 RepID=A0AAV9JR32_9PEZI|nr:hypothetical protein LTR36_001087 [Oleoguttula mirabilis]